MVGTDKLVRVASKLAAEFRSTMRAAVFNHGYAAVLRACNNDRGRPDIGADEVAGIRDFRLERDVIPGRSMEDALDLTPIDRLVGIDPVRNLR